MSFYTLVYEAAKKIPKGKVATYGQLARMCGNPRAARAVGYALHCCPSDSKVPCHRVVNRFGSLSGRFSFGGADMQKTMLNREGVIVSQDYIVDLDSFCWNGGTEK